MWISRLSKTWTLALAIAFVGIASAAPQPHSLESCANELLAQTEAARLAKTFTSLHKNPQVQSSAQRVGLGQSTPDVKLAAWLMRLEHLRRKIQESPAARALMIHQMEQAFVTRPEDVSHKFFAHRLRRAQELGHAITSFTRDQKAEIAEQHLSAQRQSLRMWLDYLLSRESDHYPMWARYWIFQGMLKLGHYKSAEGTFTKRDKGTMAPFAELNREALALTVEKVKSSATLPDFGKVYGRTLAELEDSRINVKTQDIRGQWVHFPKGSDPLVLVAALKDQGTGWCTAVESFARQQLAGGDFHIYFSVDDNGAYTLPRIAILFEGERIIEVRGRGEQQNLDSAMAGSGILEEKLQSFGAEGDRYLQRVHDMRRLTLLEQKQSAQREFTTDELRFLYELDRKIEGFGHQRDPRIYQLITGRKISEDLAKAFGYVFRAEDVQVSREVRLSGGDRYHVKDQTLYVLQIPGLASGGQLPWEVRSGPMRMGVPPRWLDQPY